MRVLIVEDEKKVASFLQRGLDAERYAVDVVHDGETALARALEGDYDLIILDLSLPERDGPVHPGDAVLRINREPVGSSGSATRRRRRLRASRSCCSFARLAATTVSPRSRRIVESPQRRKRLYVSVASTKAVKTVYFAFRSTSAKYSTEATTRA